MIYKWLTRQCSVRCHSRGCPLVRRMTHYCLGRTFVCQVNQSTQTQGLTSWSNRRQNDTIEGRSSWYASTTLLYELRTCSRPVPSSRTHPNDSQTWLPSPPTTAEWHTNNCQPLSTTNLCQFLCCKYVIITIPCILWSHKHLIWEHNSCLNLYDSMLIVVRVLQVYTRHLKTKSHKVLQPSLDQTNVVLIDFSSS